MRVHCLNLEFMKQKACLCIPWTSASVRGLLNTMSDLESTPSKVQRLWHTLKWLSKRLGLLDPDSLTSLQEKKNAVRYSLVSAVLLPQKRARLPSLTIVRLLEEGASLYTTGDGVPEGGKKLRPTDPYILAVARFLLGCSGRFSDAQHTPPSSLRITSTTTELTAWQTKTTSVLQNRQ